MCSCSADKCLIANSFSCFKPRRESSCSVSSLTRVKSNCSNDDRPETSMYGCYMNITHCVIAWLLEAFAELCRTVLWPMLLKASCLRRRPEADGSSCCSPMTGAAHVRVCWKPLGPRQWCSSQRGSPKVGAQGKQMQEKCIIHMKLDAHMNNVIIPIQTYSNI